MKISKNHNIKSVTFGTHFNKITQKLSILYLQSTLEGLYNFQFQIVYKKIDDKFHR